jgi:hypothetical protein
MSHSKPKLPIRGRWRIVSMTAWDQDLVNAEVPAFIEFDPFGTGEFQFGDFRGIMDCRPATRDDEPSVEWTWEGNGGVDTVAGRGWAVLNGDDLFPRRRQVRIRCETSAGGNSPEKEMTVWVRTVMADYRPFRGFHHRYLGGLRHFRCGRSTQGRKISRKS